MLGWEFPPQISGGLGIACYNIVKSLRSHASITLILPFLTQRIKLAGIRMIGIGNLNLGMIFTEKERAAILSKFKIKVRELKVSPYPVISPGKFRIQKTSRASKISYNNSLLENPLADVELYGENVLEKVGFYAEICRNISRKIPFDIIHAHDWMTFPAALALKEASGKPLVIHIHSLNTDRIGPDHQGWVFNLEKNALNQADLIIPVSRYTGEMIEEHYAIGKNKIFPVHNGVNPVKVFHSPRKFPEKLILFLGRITYQKGPEYFLEVASRVIGKYKNVRFVIAGEGDRFSHMVEQSAYKDIGHKFHFTGFINRKRVYELFSMTDIFLMPSVSEPFGLVALEAAQFGIPVILSRHSGAAEVLKGALKADFWDADLMVSYIVRLLSDDKFLNNVVRQQQRDLKSLSWDSNAVRIAEAYSRLLNR